MSPRIFNKYLLIGLFLLLSVFEAEAKHPPVVDAVDRYVKSVLPEASIPGLSIALIVNGEKYFLNYGKSDVSLSRPVNSNTLFQIGSCSKAFTALAVIKLANEGKIRLDNNVSHYIPWFQMKFKDRITPVTISQLLHHTSGIPWNSISKITSLSSSTALEETIKTICKTELRTRPGTTYEYATINYDILALVIERVTSQKVESYVANNIFKSLKLNSTFFEDGKRNSRKASGYKIGFCSPRYYGAPLFRANNAAGYIVSDIRDMSSWLAFQMGQTKTPLYKYAQISHQRDESVAPVDLSFYAGGWKYSLKGDQEISHGGNNPNFTAFVGFQLKKKIGVTLLANSNSAYTEILGHNILKMLAGISPPPIIPPSDQNDTLYSFASGVLCLYVLGLVLSIGYICFQVYQKKRKYSPLTGKGVYKLLLLFSILVPVNIGIYQIPAAVAGFDWKTILVWMPYSFQVLIITMALAIGFSILAYTLSLIFPPMEKLISAAPKVLIMSVISGVSNMALILLITSAFNSNIPYKYLIFYYFLIFAIYIFSRKYAQTSLIKFTRELIFDLRLKLIDKILSTSYQKFEKIDRGRVYTSLNDDVSTIGDSVNLFVMLTTSLFTAIGAFCYLATLAFWATLITVAFIIILTGIYFLVSRNTSKFFGQARDSRDVFMRLVNAMVDGYKELSLHLIKKLQFKADIEHSANEYRMKTSIASIRFLNASLIGESVLMLILGAVVFVVPKMFQQVQLQTIMSFIIILLYLIGPVNSILGSAPAIMRLRIAWMRIQKFNREIPSDTGLVKLKPSTVRRNIESIVVENVKFQYKTGNDGSDFSVGPISLKANKGEIVFIIGGNGSGKTTFAKLLTGLYEPDEGRVLIDGKVVSASQIGESFSTVFSPFYLFEKLYNVDTYNKSSEVSHYLKTLDLDSKVKISDGFYSTTKLSGGQRKRLALLQCYLEDSPIYLFDEWAADQDPGYRNFFYRTLLPEMRMNGKIVIAITHDDHYFDVADRVYKMERGQLHVLSEIVA